MKGIRDIPPLSPNEIKALRHRERLDQASFAHWLNVSKTTVSEWERGIKKPSGAASLLLTIVKHRGIEALIFFGGVSRMAWLHDETSWDIANKPRQKGLI